MDLTLLPSFVFIRRDLSRTHAQTYLHTQLLQTHPFTSRSSPRPAVSSPPSPTSFSLPSPPPQMKYPLLAPCSLSPIQHLDVIFPPVLTSGAEFSPNQMRKSLIPGLCIIFFCLYPKASVLTAYSWVSVQRSSLCTGKITLKPDMRHWNAETSSISHWLTQDFIFMSHYPFIEFGCLLGKSNFCSLCLQFSFSHSNIHTQLSPHVLVAFSLQPALRMFPTHSF